MSAAGRDHPHRPGSLSKRQGTSTPDPDGGEPLPTLPDPWSLHEAVLEGALLAGSPPPASLRRATFTANTSQKV